MKKTFQRKTSLLEPRDRAMGLATVSTTWKYRISYHSQRLVFSFSLHLIDWSFVREICDWHKLKKSKCISIFLSLTSGKQLKMGRFVLLISIFVYHRIETTCYRFLNCSVNRFAPWVPYCIQGCVLHCIFIFKNPPCFSIYSGLSSHVP